MTNIQNIAVARVAAFLLLLSSFYCYAATNEDTNTLSRVWSLKVQASFKNEAATIGELISYIEKLSKTVDINGKGIRVLIVIDNQNSSGSATPFPLVITCDSTLYDLIRNICELTNMNFLIFNDIVIIMPRVVAYKPFIFNGKVLSEGKKDPILELTLNANKEIPKSSIVVNTNGEYLCVVYLPCVSFGGGQLQGKDKLLDNAIELKARAPGYADRIYHLNSEKIISFGINHLNICLSRIQGDSAVEKSGGIGIKNEK